MKTVIVLMAIVLLLCTGCSHTEVYGDLDLSEKTIIVPPGNNRLVKDCKKILRECGWKVIVKSNHRRVTEFNGSKAESYDDYNARYELVVTSVRRDIALDMSAYIDYEYSLIDNETGEEIFASSGDTSQRIASNEFKKLIGCPAN